VRIAVFTILILSSVLSALQAGAKPLSLQELEALALENNGDYLAAQKQAGAAESALRATGAAFLPAFSANTGWLDKKTTTEPEKGYLGYLEGRVNLYRGGRDSAERVLSGIELSRAELQLEQRRRELLRQVRDLFAVMVSSQEMLMIELEERKTNEEQKRMAAKKVSAGLTSEVDTIEFELREQAIEGTIRKFRSQLEQARASLAVLIGESEIREVAGEIPAPADWALPEEPFVKSLVYRTSVLENTKAGTRHDALFGEYLPELSLRAAYGRITGTERPFSSDKLESSYGVLLSIPLFSGFDTRYRRSQASFEQEAAEKSVTQGRAEIEAVARNVGTEKKALLDLYKINEKRLERLAKYFQLTISEYRRGVKNSPDLVGATENLFDARKRRVELQKDLSVLRNKAEELWGEI